MPIKRLGDALFDEESGFVFAPAKRGGFVTMVAIERLGPLDFESQREVRAAERRLQAYLEAGGRRG